MKLLTRRAARLVPGLLLASACAAPAAEPALEPVARPALDGGRIEANWKERLAQPYVFLEHSGDYRRLGEAMRRLFDLAAELDLETGGAPFALFFDDPGRVPVSELRARACLPVSARPDRLGELRYDLLPRAMVVYARVPGPYPDAARSYPLLFSYLHDLGWRQGGPVRELYLVNPAEAASAADLVTEVQIPWAARDE